MNSVEAAAVVVATVAASLCGAYWLAYHLRQAASTRDRLIREAHERADSYEGPDSLRLMQELDAHLDAYADQLAGLYERLGTPPSPDPMWDAGRERLWNAVRDNQTKEDTH